MFDGKILPETSVPTGTIGQVMLNLTEVRLSTGETLLIEDNADHTTIGQALAENGHFTTTRLRDGMNGPVKSPITILERSIAYLQPRD